MSICRSGNLVLAYDFAETHSPVCVSKCQFVDIIYLRRRDFVQRFCSFCPAAFSGIPPGRILSGAIQCPGGFCPGFVVNCKHDVL